MKSVPVFFFRGLSTYGYDNARWGVFDFGPVYKHIARELSARDLDFQPVTGLGSGSLRELASRGLAFLRAHPVWQNPTNEFHLLGHSAGGLIARLVLEELRTRGEHERIRSLLTVASPNHGSALARICAEMPQLYRGSTLFLKSCGYDIATKKHFFNELTPESVAKTFSGMPLPDHFTKTGSIVCWSPRRDWCVPLRLFYKIKAFDDFTTPSDGVVERETQILGELVAEIPIDHFRQVGLFGGEDRFRQLMDTTAQFFKNQER